MKVRLAKRSTWILVAGLVLQAAALLVYQGFHDRLVRKDTRGYPYVAEVEFSRSDDYNILSNLHFLSPDTAHTAFLYLWYGRTEFELRDNQWEVTDQYHLPGNVCLSPGPGFADVDGDNLHELVYLRFWPLEALTNQHTTNIDSVWICAYGADRKEIVLERLTTESMADLFDAPPGAGVVSIHANMNDKNHEITQEDSSPFFAVHLNLEYIPLDYRRAVLVYEKGESPIRTSAFQTAIITSPGVWSTLDNGQTVYSFAGSPPANGVTVHAHLDDGSLVKLVDNRLRAFQIDPAGHINWIREFGSAGGGTRVFPSPVNPDHLVAVTIRSAFADIPSVLATELRVDGGLVTDSMRWSNAHFQTFVGSAVQNGYLGAIRSDPSTTIILKDRPSSSYSIQTQSSIFSGQTPLVKIGDRTAFVTTLGSEVTQLVDVDNGDILCVLNGSFRAVKTIVPAGNGNSSERLILSDGERFSVFVFTENPFTFWRIWHHRWLVVFSIVPLLLVLLALSVSEIRHRRRVEKRRLERRIDDLSESLQTTETERNSARSQLASDKQRTEQLQAEVRQIQEDQAQTKAQQQQNEHRLRLLVAQFTSLLNSVEEGLAEIDQHGIILQANEAFARTCGMALSSVIGVPAYRVFGITNESLRSWFVAHEDQPRFSSSLDVDVEVRDPQNGPTLRKHLHLRQHPFPGVDGNHRLLVIQRAVPVEPVVETSTSIARFGGMVTCSPLMKRAFEELQHALDESFPALVIGENGTGKTQLVHGLRELCMQRKVPFVEHSPVATPANLLEGTLFGTRRGSFTNAVDTPGMFKTADGGILFLDEIGELPLELQAKLLKATDRNPVEIMPVGASKPVKVDVKLITATNRDLTDLVAEKTFQEDLYYRLSGRIIRIPALRERPEDIPLLVEHFLAQWRNSSGNTEMRVDDHTLNVLMRMEWPGNVRQLERMIMVAATKARENVLHIDEQDVVSATHPNGNGATPEATTTAETPSHKPDSTKHKRSDKPSRDELLAALEAHEYNISSVAKSYGYTRQTVHNWMNSYDIKRS
ncbi:sigma 54-interacting transcriptional regulator [bacterium]|nr:sigma 54-interacting transcriptional regulator [bacterium]